MSFQPFIRDIQSRFSFLIDGKFALQRSLRTIQRVPFEDEYKILKYLNPNGRCAIDVGANRGQSIDAIRLYHPEAIVESFEPNKGLFDKLTESVSKNKNLKLYNLGLGKEEYSAPLYIPYYRDFMYDGLSSFSKERASNWLSSETVWRFNPDLLRVEQHSCNITILDQFSFSPFFLKIHVQGYEEDVLKGAKETISLHSPVLLLANNEKADSWLRSKGWYQFVLKDGDWVCLEQNSMEHYNCVYFNPENSEHQQIMNVLNQG